VASGAEKKTNEGGDFFTQMEQKNNSSDTQIKKEKHQTKLR
jgi:hypothetical protein